jgi:hypothetical protein
MENLLQTKLEPILYQKNGSYKISTMKTLTQKMICQKGVLADDEIEFLDVENLILNSNLEISILSEDEKPHQQLVLLRAQHKKKNSC